MKKKTAILLVFALVISLVGCSGKGSEEEIISDSSSKPKEVKVTEEEESRADESIVINKATITFSKESEERYAVETDAATAVNQYLVARMYLDMFLQYDIENGNPEEYGELLQKTIDAFVVVNETADNLAESASELEKMEDDSSYSGADGSGEYQDLACASDEGLFNWDPFTVVAYAEEESDAVKWAKDITERFDKAPAGKGIRTLAEQMGTDAKHAYAQLRQAQDILAGNAYNDFAKTADAAYKTAKVLKTAGTAAQLTLSIVTANPATMTEAVMASGGILVNGVNTMLEIGQTGSVLIVGDDNKVSQTLENIENAIAPIGSALGAYSLASNLMKGAEFFKDVPAMADSVMYIGTSLHDYLSEGKIMGGMFTQKADGTIEGTLASTMTIKSAWAKPEEAKEEVLTSVGYSPEEIKAVTVAAEEVKEETATDVTTEIPMEIIEEILEEVAEFVPEPDDIPDVATIEEEIESAAEEDEVFAEYVDGEYGIDGDEDTDDDTEETIEEETDEAEEDDSVEETASEQSEFPGISEVCGSFSYSVHMTMGDQEADGTLIYVFSNTGGNTLSMLDESGLELTGTYDESTGKATFHDTDGTPIRVTFTRTDSGSVKSKISINAEYGTMNGSGTKR